MWGFVRGVDWKLNADWLRFGGIDWYKVAGDWRCDACNGTMFDRLFVECCCIWGWIVLGIDELSCYGVLTVFKSWKVLLLRIGKTVVELTICCWLTCNGLACWYAKADKWTSEAGGSAITGIEPREPWFLALYCMLLRMALIKTEGRLFWLLAIL